MICRIHIVHYITFTIDSKEFCMFLHIKRVLKLSKKFIFAGAVIIICIFAAVFYCRRPSPISKTTFALNTAVTITLYGNYNESLIDACFDLCRQYKKCVVVHGQSDMFSIPDKWADMAKAYPDVPVILFHIGIPMMVERSCQLAKDIPNFYVSTSGSYVPAIKMAYEVAGPEKILFSSDAPFGNIKQEIAKVEYVCKNPAHLDLIFAENARQIMNLCEYD